MYNVYNGFLRGFYRSHLVYMVHPDCFGADGWLERNLTMLDKVAVTIVSGGNVPESQAYEAARDLVNIVYLNRDKCEFTRVFTDVKTFPYFGGSIIENIATKIITIGLRAEHVIEKGIEYWQIDSV